MTCVLALEGISKSFNTDPPIQPLKGVDLEVAGGQIVAITGVSGKGKSTLLNVAGGLLRPDEGCVLFNGEDLYGLTDARLDALHRKGIGFVFQSPYLFQALTARENLLFAQKTCLGSWDETAVDRALDEIGMTDRANHLPCELSVGQKRRLVIARSFLVDHDLILADEPTNDLDDAWSNFVFERFAAYVLDKRKAVVVVTHDNEYARRADVVYVLEGGKLTRRERA